MSDAPPAQLLPELLAPARQLASQPAITDVAAARALVARFRAAPAIALDTEGDGMFRYRARLCTLQLASERELAVVDTLQLDVAVFAELLDQRGPEKVVHDVSFDARLLASQGITLGPLFDTAIAARFLGFAATGLASLLSQLFGLQLPKHMQQADWGARPLSAEAIAYLENDVRYLLPLRDVLLERMRAIDIEAEVREECAYALAEARRGELEPSPFARVKGAAARPAHERARLYELALTRDEIARELDLPATRAIASELLLRFAELREPSQLELEQRLSAKMRPYGARLHEALTRAASRTDAPEEELAGLREEAPSPSQLALRKRRRELLMGFRSREAVARGVDPQVVLPGHCLTGMTRLEQLDDASLGRVPGLGACRIERYARSWRESFATQWS